MVFNFVSLLRYILHITAVIFFVKITKNFKIRVCLMTFKSRYQVVLYIGINIRGGAFVRNLLVVLEKPAEILEHCEQFSTELHLVFPFLT